MTAPDWPRQLSAAGATRLLAAAADWLLLLDPQTRVVDVRARDATLQQSLRKRWRGRLWTDTVTVESRDKLSQLLQAAREGDPPLWRHVNHPQVEGPDWPAQYIVLPAADGDAAGAAAPWLALGRDLREHVETQRRLVQAQQAVERDHWRLREEQARFRSLFDATSEAVLLVDAAEGRVREANPAALAWLGGGTSGADGSARGRAGARGAAPSIVGAPWLSLFARADAARLGEAADAACAAAPPPPLTATLAAGGTVEVALRSYAQGPALHLLVRLAPGAGVAARALSATPTPQRELAARAADYVDKASDALAFTDTTGRVLAANRAFLRLAQAPSEDAVRGQGLDRWLGRTGAELSVLLTGLKQGGSAGLFSAAWRGERGLSTEVEVASCELDADAGGIRGYAFALRDAGAQAPSQAAEPARGGGLPVVTSRQQLVGLVGKVPLKQIVSEAGDLIERLAIEAALELSHDNRALAAQLLGLSRQSLYVKLRRFGLGDLPPAEG